MRCTSTAGNGTAMNKRRAIIIVLVMLGGIESREVAYAQKLKVPSDSSRGTNSSNLYSADSDKSSDGNHKEPLGSINKQDLRGNQAVTQSSHQKGQPSASSCRPTHHRYCPTCSCRLRPLTLPRRASAVPVLVVPAARHMLENSRALMDPKAAGSILGIAQPGDDFRFGCTTPTDKTLYPRRRYWRNGAAHIGSPPERRGKRQSSWRRFCSNVLLMPSRLTQHLDHFFEIPTNDPGLLKKGSFAFS